MLHPQHNSEDADMSRFGGTNGLQWFNDVWSYDPRQNIWSQLDCIGYIPISREGHSAALVNDIMYIFGGRTEEGADLGDLAAFKISSRRWYTFQNMGPCPSPRSGHSMTAFGQQIIVLAGEPSSGPRNAGELSLAYILDTNKIRYPNDQQIQQTPASERVQGNRRPSAEWPPGSQIRGPSRDASRGPDEESRNQFSGARENTSAEANSSGSIGPGGRGQDLNTSGSSTQPPGSRLPRASATQSPSGPPPQQPAPQPRVNGVISQMTGPRSRTPTRDNRGFGSRLDTIRSVGLSDNDVENDTPAMSPTPRETPRPAPSIRTISPAVSGRRTPVQTSAYPASKPINSTFDEDDPPGETENLSRAHSRQAGGESTFDEVDGPPVENVQQRRSSPDHYLNGLYSSASDDSPKKIPPSLPVQPPNEPIGKQETQLEELLKELEAVKSRNIWYASELELARKAGYQQTSSHGPALNQRATPSFGEEDKPLIEALIIMRAQLVEVQGSLESRVNAAAKEVAEIEQQRDFAIREAAYAKAKLAAHGGSHAGTPLPDAMSKEGGDDDRSSDLSRKLATTLATQTELRTTVSSISAELELEKRARQLAETTADAANKRVTELTLMRDPGEMESLRTELHEVGKVARDEAAAKSEALAQMQMLQLDNNDLNRRLEGALEDTKQHTALFVSLREAVGASSDKATLLEQQLEAERTLRGTIDQKLQQIRTDYEDRTAELETTTRKLRDAEELMEKHAGEARTHRQAFIAGLDKISTRNASENASGLAEEQITTMRQQVEQAHALVRKNQADADDAAEKLRRAEERIAGLEAFQEQSSRESLSIRRQLQDAVRESQSNQSMYVAVQQQLESHQRDASALLVQHNALKDLLEERGVSDPGRSRKVDSPASRYGTPDQSLVIELEQQLKLSLKEHEETKASFENREQEKERAYHEKLEGLDKDYQSAVRYVKRMEKMFDQMKDELAKYKTQSAQLQRELEGTPSSRSRSVKPEAAAEWEEERQELRREMSEMQESVKESVAQFGRQVEEFQTELFATQEERDHYRQGHEQMQQQLAHTTDQARTELEQLRHQNATLESRAIDAEQKVSLLLDQLDSSVGNYRRRSQDEHSHLTANGQGHEHHRNLSSSTADTTSSTLPNANITDNHHTTRSASGSISSDADPSSSAFPPPPDPRSHPSTLPEDRNSLTLNSLTSELKSIQSQWEGSHRNFRLSNQTVDFDQGPPSAVGEGGMSESLASWRRKLEEEERQKELKDHVDEEREEGKANWQNEVRIPKGPRTDNEENEKPPQENDIGR